MMNATSKDADEYEAEQLRVLLDHLGNGLKFGIDEMAMLQALLKNKTAQEYDAEQLRVLLDHIGNGLKFGIDEMAMLQALLKNKTDEDTETIKMDDDKFDYSMLMKELVNSDTRDTSFYLPQNQIESLLIPRVADVRNLGDKYAAFETAFMSSVYADLKAKSTRYDPEKHNAFEIKTIPYSANKVQRLSGKIPDDQYGLREKQDEIGLDGLRKLKEKTRELEEEKTNSLREKQDEIDDLRRKLEETKRELEEEKKNRRNKREHHRVMVGEDRSDPDGSHDNCETDEQAQKLQYRSKKVGRTKEKKQQRLKQRIERSFPGRNEREHHRLMVGEDRSDPDGSDDSCEIDEQAKQLQYRSRNFGKRKGKKKRTELKKRAERGDPDGSDISIDYASSSSMDKMHDKVNMMESKITTSDNIDGGNDWRWYWKNHQQKIWVEFDQTNNENINREYREDKPDVQVVVNNHGYQLTFQDMKMKAINKDHTTLVEYAIRQPIYEKSDKGFTDSECEDLSLNTGSLITSLGQGTCIDIGNNAEELIQGGIAERHGPQQTWEDVKTSNKEIGFEDETLPCVPGKELWKSLTFPEMTMDATELDKSTQWSIQQRRKLMQMLPVSRKRSAKVVDQQLGWKKQRRKIQKMRSQIINQKPDFCAVNFCYQIMKGGVKMEYVYGKEKRSFNQTRNYSVFAYYRASSLAGMVDSGYAELSLDDGSVFSSLAQDGSDNDEETSDVTTLPAKTNAPWPQMKGYVDGQNELQWFWKNRSRKAWENFDKANNDRLDKYFLKGKPFVHVIVNNVWYHVAFKEKKMETINKSEKTLVERAQSKPTYVDDESEIDNGDTCISMVPTHLGDEKICPRCGNRVNDKRKAQDFAKSRTEKVGRIQHPDFKHKPERSPPSSPPPSPPPPPGAMEFPFSDRIPDRSEELSSAYATKHGDVRLLRALTFLPECKDLSDRGLFFPLHTAASLGLKRTATYLLQSGFDLDERNEFGCTPFESIDRRKNRSLFEYMIRVGGVDPSPQSTTPGQEDAGIESGGSIACVTMERIDLPTKTIYLPSEQFRTACREGQTAQKVFFVAPFVSKYKTVCMYQMYGLLYVLGQCKSERNIRQCLSHAILPEADLMKHKDCNSGVFNFDAWFNSSRPDRRGDHTEEIPSWISSLLQGTLCSESSVSILCDGWTPMHYAILMHNDALVEHLLQNGEGYLKDKAYTLLPKFILDTLKAESRFEYEYVYSHIGGFTPLMLATFIENETALVLLFQNSEQISRFACTDIDDALSLAYCDGMESVLLRALCKAGNDYLSKNHQIDVNLEPHYRKENPMRRILFAASSDVIDEIEENFFTLEIRVENKAIIKEYLYTTNNVDVVSEEEDTLLAETIECHSDRLWNRHSSLNAIIPGHISAVRDGCQGYDKKIIVVLYSNDKELTPSSEIPFQEYLFTDGSNILVHVVEGFFKFDSAVRVGQSIDLSNDEMRATLGPFVQSSQNKKGVLTCAHTFLRDFFSLSNTASKHDEKFDPEIPSQLKTVYFETDGLIFYNEQSNNNMDLQTDEPIEDGHNAMDYDETQRPCGYLKRLLFQPEKDTGIDVALILFNDDDTFTCSPQLFLGHPMYRQQLRVNKVPSLNHLIFHNGQEVVPTPCNEQPQLVCKCGTGTGFTVGYICFDKATGQFKVNPNNNNENMGVGHGQRKFKMKGQIVVHHGSEGSFSEMGDSGAAVFLFDKNKKCPTECVGICIGRMNNTPVSIVTPIRSILEELSDQNTKYQLMAFSGNEV